METAYSLSSRFKEVIYSGKWIANTNWKEQLDDVQWHQAVAPWHSFNTLAQLTFHIYYYISGFNDFFETGDFKIKDKYSFDCPEILSEKDWSKLKHGLFEHCEEFCSNIENLSVEKLDSVFVKAEYGNYRRNIEGVIEHAYYHLGQVVLIKKGLTK